MPFVLSDLNRYDYKGAIVWRAEFSSGERTVQFEQTNEGLEAYQQHTGESLWVARDQWIAIRGGGFQPAHRTPQARLPPILIPPQIPVGRQPVPTAPQSVQTVSQPVSRTAPQSAPQPASPAPAIPQQPAVLAPQPPSTLPQPVPIEPSPLPAARQPVPQAPAAPEAEEQDENIGTGGLDQSTEDQRDLTGPPATPQQPVASSSDSAHASPRSESPTAGPRPDQHRVLQTIDIWGDALDDDVNSRPATRTDTSFIEQVDRAIALIDLLEMTPQFWGVARDVAHAYDRTSMNALVRHHFQSFVDFLGLNGVLELEGRPAGEVATFFVEKQEFARREQLQRQERVREETADDNTGIHSVQGDLETEEE